MGLWMMLFLHLHLGNVPGIEVVYVSLPAPSNVSISSFNMEHTLSFLPGPETPSNSHFTVEILHLSLDQSGGLADIARNCIPPPPSPLKKKVWRPVAGCLELTAGQTCNLTRAFRDPFAHYQARIQAFTPTQTSNWTSSGGFQPLSDTVLGPPDVSVSGCGNCLLLLVRVPTRKGLQQLKNFYTGLVIHVQRTRDKTQFRLSLPFKEENLITYLQPGMEYCVTVSVTSIFNSKSVSSNPCCAFTSAPLPRSTLYVVFGLLGAFCVLGFLLIGLGVYGGQLSLNLLRQRLPRTVVSDPCDVW